ncbi:MAG: hypothetical protein HMLKMBBP_02243 [Planctomycetes bacterium]|nr:hypothetical protein [Planctomycetota bacterium]
MRFLADENFPGPVVRDLRAQGHDVVWVLDAMRGSADRDVLHAAQVQRRVLLTCDKGFGELAFGTALPAECGVILFRLGGPDPVQDNAHMLRVLVGRDDWTGNFAVVTDRGVRLRSLRRGPKMGPPSHD